MYPRDAELLWAAVVSVSIKHAQAPDTKRKELPQARYSPEDASVLWALVADVRNEHHIQKLQERSGGGKARFEVAKSMVLTQYAKHYSWSIERRNFYSSVISTYFSWSHHGIPEEAQRLIDAVRTLPSSARALW